MAEQLSASAAKRFRNSYRTVPLAYTREITGARPKKLRIHWPVEVWCQDNLEAFRFSWSRTYGRIHIHASPTDLLLFAIHFP